MDLGRRLGRMLTLQPQYILRARATEWELIPVCEAEDLRALPCAPLRGGWLNGRYTREMTGARPGSRVDTAGEEGWCETWDACADEHAWRILDVLRNVAGARRRPSARVAIRWVSQRPGVTAPILGASTYEQLETNLGAIAWSLTEDDTDRLTIVSEIRSPSPCDSVISDPTRPLTERGSPPGQAVELPTSATHASVRRPR